MDLPQKCQAPLTLDKKPYTAMPGPEDYITNADQRTEESSSAGKETGKVELQGGKNPNFFWIEAREYSCERGEVSSVKVFWKSKRGEPEIKREKI